MSWMPRGAWLAWMLAAMPAAAEITTDGSLGAAGPITPINGTYEILDDYGRYRGDNLFHSFGVFGVENGRTAVFSAEHAERIIARVTGGSRSLISGALKTVGGADLFLLNPSGITFARTSTIDVEGSLHLSTAELLRFEDDPASDFDATSSAPDPPLSMAKPSAFGFLGAPAPGALRFNQVTSISPLPAGETFSAVGGSVTLIGTGHGLGNDDDGIRIPSGRIQIAAVDRAVDVPVEDLSQLRGDALAAAVSNDSPSIQLGVGFDLDVSADVDSTASAGRVVIRGGSLSIDDSTVKAFHWSATEDAAHPAIDIEMVRGVELTEGGLLTTRSTNQGRSGGTAVVAHTASFDGEGSGIQSLSLAGEGGPSVLRVHDLLLTNGGFVSSQSEAGGAGGLIDITANQIYALVREIDPMAGETEPTTGGQIVSFAKSSGPGGDILIRADRVFVSNVGNVANPASIASIVLKGATGEGGDLTLEVRELEVADGGGVFTRTDGAGKGGNLEILGAERVLVQGMDAGIPGTSVLPRRAALTAFTEKDSTGSGGTLSVTSDVVEVLDGGQVSTTTQGAGNAEKLKIDAAERVSVRGGANGPSFVSSDSRLVPGAVLAPGAGGEVGIETALLEVRDGGRVTASTDGTLDAGRVHIVAGEVVISGVDPTAAQNPSVVQSRSNANLPDGGNGGAIEIDASGDVTVSDRGEIASSTAAGGDAGTIDVSAGGSLRLERMASVAARKEDGSAGGGGSIQLTANQGIFISGDSVVATESLGSGAAGDIAIDAGPSLEVADSKITTEAADSSGGRITIIADQIVHLKEGSELTTSVGSGVGGGGDIDIDPEFVVVDQSTIKANAVGGDGGDITITAGAFFSTPDSVIEASSEVGIDGTISIVAPDTDVTSGITTLPSSVLDATALMKSACSAATAEGGSFVVSARPGLPVAPDSLLAAFDERTTQSAVASAPVSGAEVRMASASGVLAGACRRASEEVL